MAQTAQAEKRPALSTSTSSVQALSKWPFVVVVCFGWHVVADRLETAVCGGLKAWGRLILIKRDGRWLVMQTAQAEKRPALSTSTSSVQALSKRPFLAVVCFWK